MSKTFSIIIVIIVIIVGGMFLTRSSEKTEIADQNLPSKPLPQQPAEDSTSMLGASVNSIDLEDSILDKDLESIDAELNNL